MTDTVNRTVYGRLFNGSFQDIANTVPSDLIGALYDSTNMPALVLDPGKQVYYDMTLDPEDIAALALPQNYTVGAILYVAIRSNFKARITFTSPTFGASRIILLEATDDATDGTHAAFWSFQGDLTSINVSIPDEESGGVITEVQAFIYEIPDLSDFESYFDKQIGLGTSGDT